MFREEYKARYDQVVPSDAFRRRLEERLYHKRSPGPVRLVAVLAALLLALAAVGAAAGVFDSLFGRMERDGFAGMPDTDYAELERRSDSTPDLNAANGRSFLWSRAITTANC